MLADRSDILLNTEYLIYWVWWKDCCTYACMY